MPLSLQFVQYLNGINVSEEIFNTLSPTERSSIYKDFSPPPGNFYRMYIHSICLLLFYYYISTT